MIVRLQNPAAAKLPAIRRLFLTALARSPKDPEYLTDLIASKCQDPRIGIFIGLEGGEPKALLTVRLPIDPQADEPLFDLAANVGSQALARECLQAGLRFTAQAGYSRALCSNLSGRSDAAYIRRARQLGVKARHVCSVIELDFGKEEDSENERKWFEPTGLGVQRLPIDPE